ncbi:Oidioi.mRNA.OKI2018_I69.chr1.g1020.t1.cds [Oikopleura dioica]|uniref:Oidioi.mRNA.OKI2018_I69.chr1.g1020.t1.cds n=1 Tax=Oikopleura dioica TaxID=34765 RepID=A0ABN7SLN4_OIKDI|nr:Oidioi.mRNA.OKI2018_I69.chr1.g1020.t1.cds [Oikopleura dioica]
MTSSVKYKKQKNYKSYEIDGDLQGEWVLEEKSQLKNEAIPKVEEYKNGDVNAKSRRGYFVIFNHLKFSGAAGEVNSKRDGTEHDLERVFTELEFEVHTYHDLTKKEVESTLQKYENCNMDDCEMFGLALLTHGDAQGIVSAKDKMLHISSFIDPIKSNPTLVGKPKLFFIQACRGQGYMNGVNIVDTSAPDGLAIEGNDDDIDPEEDEDLAERLRLGIPKDADILVHFAQSEGYTSTRNPYVGSTFIIALCYFLRYAYQLELHQILVRTNSLVALRETSTYDPASDRKKQMPVIQSQLTKLLYLKPRKNKKSSLEQLKLERENVKVENNVPSWLCKIQ